MQEPLGKLAIVSTPIGNLGDITYRAVEILKDADYVAAEDTRRAGILLAHFEIKKSITSYHKDNEHGKTSKLIQDVFNGKKVAMVVDAGTPSISDPGFLLVRRAIREGIEPEIIPGVSALTFCVVSCGFPVTQFSFAGFLPSKKLKRRKVLKQLAENNETLFLFESPKRLSQLLLEIKEELGPEARVAIVREATKRYEETIRGSAEDLLQTFKERDWKGEITVAITLKQEKK